MNSGFIQLSLDITLRSLVTVITLFLITRLMGKKSIAQLTIFDYIAGMALGSIAGSVSVNENVSFPQGILSMLIWGVAAIAVAYASLKGIKLRRLLGSTPTILVQNGKILERNLRKERFNLNDFLEEMRIKQVFNIADVEFAILETNGQVSVQLKSQKQPVTPSDLGINTQYHGLSANLIIDGEIMQENLRLVKLDETWLSDSLKKQGVESSKDVLLASLDTRGELYVSKKKNEARDLKILE